MAPVQDDRLPEESSHKSSKESASSLAVVGERVLVARDIRSFSTPSLPQLSENEFQVPPRKPHAHSCPLALSEENQLNCNSNSNTEPSEYEEGEPEEAEEQMDETPASTFTEFINLLIDTIVRLRNSSFIHFYQLLVAITFITAVVMGVSFSDSCQYLPIYGAVTGLVGTLFIFVWMSMTFCKQRGKSCFHHEKFILGFFFITLVLLAVVDLILLCIVSPSLTKSDRNYCDEGFYYYSIHKQINLAINLVFAAILYLPRRRCREWCCNYFDLQISLPDVHYRAVEAEQ